MAEQDKRGKQPEVQIHPNERAQLLLEELLAQMSRSRDPLGMMAQLQHTIANNSPAEVLRAEGQIKRQERQDAREDELHEAKMAQIDKDKERSEAIEKLKGEIIAITSWEDAFYDNPTKMAELGKLGLKSEYDSHVRGLVEQALHDAEDQDKNDQSYRNRRDLLVRIRSKAIPASMYSSFEKSMNRDIEGKVEEIVKRRIPDFIASQEDLSKESALRDKFVVEVLKDYPDLKDEIAGGGSKATMLKEKFKREFEDAKEARKRVDGEAIGKLLEGWMDDEDMFKRKAGESEDDYYKKVSNILSDPKKFDTPVVAELMKQGWTKTQAEAQVDRLRKLVMERVKTQDSDGLKNTMDNLEVKRAKIKMSMERLKFYGKYLKTAAIVGGASALAFAVPGGGQAWLFGPLFGIGAGAAHELGDFGLGKLGLSTRQVDFQLSEIKSKDQMREAYQRITERSLVVKNRGKETARMVREQLENSLQEVKKRDPNANYREYMEDLRKQLEDTLANMGGVNYEQLPAVA